MNDFTKARHLIMRDILSFYITHNWEPNKEYPRLTASIRGFVSQGFSNPVAQPGDLVILTAVPPSKWNIGWLRAIEEHGGDTRYLIESLEDGDACWWSNVGLSFMPRRDMNPRYLWSDRQFAFQKKWYDIVEKHGTRPVRALDCVFNGNEVSLHLRKRWDYESAPIVRNHTNYRKATKAQLVELLQSMEEECNLAGQNKETNQ